MVLKSWTIAGLNQILKQIKNEGWKSREKRKVYERWKVGERKKDKVGKGNTFSLLLSSHFEGFTLFL